MVQKVTKKAQKTQLKTLKSLQRFLLRNGDAVTTRRLSPERPELRERLDEALLAFRVARDVTPADETKSWLRAVRQATGVPVYVMADRLGVTKHEIFRLEKSEWESRIVLANLRRAALALGCELVYALVPQKGTLAELAAGEKGAQEEARAAVRQEAEQGLVETAAWVGLRREALLEFRRALRREGMRTQ
jgi:transcriptional regulator with XRE-family HTH domain